MNKRKSLLRTRSTHSFQIIILGFLGLVLIGAFLLSLPISSQDGKWLNFGDALFTATSAACVTGLIVRDTASSWTIFGQSVILILIQIGGMGVITLGVAVVKLSGKKIGVFQRSMMQESISAPKIGGIVKLTSFIIKASAIIELAGALLIMPVMIRDFGVGRGIWYSFFHSISAFCNAGFDLMGSEAPYSSLTNYTGNVYFNIVIMLLIIIGGISFMTWDDIKVNRHHVKKYSLQSKVILVTSAVLILLPAVYFFFCEYAGVPMKDRIMGSLFQSVTTRTAGFNTTDLSQMSDPGKIIMTVLMLIGGSPGSTAGGMKTTTVAVLLLAAVSVFRRRSEAQAFKRRIPDETVRTAGAILFMYLVLFLASGIIINRIEGGSLIDCLFETGSAVGTVGLTVGLTPSLSLSSKIILMVLMFFGRVGGLTLIYATVPSGSDSSKRMPLEKINVG